MLGASSGQIKVCVLFIAVLLLTIGVRVYKIQDKHDLFLDEYLTIVLSNYGDSGWTTHFSNEGKVYTGKEVKQGLYGAENSLSDIRGSALKLRGTTRDNPLTNLHYTLFKASLWGADSSDIQQVIFRGFALNLLLFVLGFLFLFNLLKLLFPDNNILIFGALALCFLHEVSVGNTLYLRCYQLEETLFIALSYLFAKFCVLLYNKEDVVRLPFLLFGSLVLAFFLLSSYFSIPYAALVWLAAFLYVFFTKRKDGLREYLFLVAILVLSQIIIYGIYPTYYGFIDSGRGVEATDKYSFGAIGANIGVCISAIGKELKNNIVSLVGLLMALGLLVNFLLSKRSGLIRKLKHAELITLALIALSFIWFAFIFYSAPYKIIRYIAPMFPILFIIFPLGCSVLSKTKQTVFVVMLSLLFFCSSICAKDMYWGVTEPSVEYQQDGETPLIAFEVKDDEVRLTPLYTDSRTVIFLSATGLDVIAKYDSVYFVSKVTPHEIAERDSLNVLSGYDIGEVVFEVGQNVCVKLRRKS